jgi:D-alanyl-D-alanine carboxypeptidase/D-alanyl-D-alanine-endopeptidase (penicillin-binding protein 4)
LQSLVSARALVAVLGNARAQPWGEAYRSALAEPGEEKSTLETRLRGLEGRLFAKTGTLTNVASLAGFLIDDEGREIAFAILVNGSNVSGATVHGAIDRLVRALAGGR